MKNPTTIRKLALAMVLMAVAGCASLKHGPDQESKDRFDCYHYKTHESKRVFSNTNSKQVRACMDRLKQERRAKFERQQVKAKRQEEVKHKATLEREKREKEYQARVKVLKSQCGNDYNRIRIGMQLERLKKCWPLYPRFRLTSQINRRDGIVSTYKTHPAFIDMCSDYSSTVGPCVFYVMDDQIVGWQ